MSCFDASIFDSAHLWLPGILLTECLSHRLELIEMDPDDPNYRWHAGRKAGQMLLHSGEPALRYVEYVPGSIRLVVDTRDLFRRQIEITLEQDKITYQEVRSWLSEDKPDDGVEEVLQYTIEPGLSRAWYGWHKKIFGRSMMDILNQIVCINERAKTFRSQMTPASVYEGVIARLNMVISDLPETDRRDLHLEGEVIEPFDDNAIRKLLVGYVAEERIASCGNIVISSDMDLKTAGDPELPSVLVAFKRVMGEEWSPGMRNDMEPILGEVLNLNEEKQSINEMFEGDHALYLAQKARESLQTLCEYHEVVWKLYPKLENIFSALSEGQEMALVA